MFSFRYITMGLSMATLAACSSTTPTVGTPPVFTPAISGTAQKDASGNYSVTQNGTTRALGPFFGSTTGAFIYTSSPSFRNTIYDTADTLAIVGLDKTAPHATFASIGGTLSTTVPTTGTGTYSGYFTMNYFKGGTTNSLYDAAGAFTTNVDFNAGTLTGTGTGGITSAGASLTVSGNLQGAEFNGTANFTAPDLVGTSTNVPVTGGFYGANTVVGIVQNADIAGVFYGN
jgi:hypothetical protein